MHATIDTIIGEVILELGALSCHIPSLEAAGYDNVRSEIIENLWEEYRGALAHASQGEGEYTYEKFRQDLDRIATTL